MDPNQPNVTVALVKSDADRAGAQFLQYIPALRSMTDDAMADALADLYLTGSRAGAKAAIKEAKNVTQDMGRWLARLAAAHQRKDAGEIAVILEEFIAERCVITGDPTPTP